MNKGIINEYIWSEIGYGYSVLLVFLRTITTDMVSDQISFADNLSINSGHVIANILYIKEMCFLFRLSVKFKTRGEKYRDFQLLKIIIV